MSQVIDATASSEGLGYDGLTSEDVEDRQRWFHGLEWDEENTAEWPLFHIDSNDLRDGKAEDPSKWPKNVLLSKQVADYLWNFVYTLTFDKTRIPRSIEDSAVKSIRIWHVSWWRLNFARSFCLYSAQPLVDDDVELARRGEEETKHLKRQLRARETREVDIVKDKDEEIERLKAENKTLVELWKAGQDTNEKLKAENETLVDLWKAEQVTNDKLKTKNAKLADSVEVAKEDANQRLQAGEDTIKLLKDENGKLSKENVNVEKQLKARNYTNQRLKTELQAEKYINIANAKKIAGSEGFKKDSKANNGKIEDSHKKVRAGMKRDYKEATGTDD